jgi:hypothetical protein
MIIPFVLLIILLIYNHLIILKKNNEKIIIIKERDEENLIKKRITDPLTPPERSEPINIRTRGSLPKYQQIGFVFQESTSIRLPLFGRPEYQGSQLYNYYVNDDTRNMIKIPLNITKEIFTGDEINIPGFVDKFITEIYQLDELKYIPYL